MNTTASRYETALRPLTDVIDAVPTEAWTNPSPCEDWTSRDVVRHLIETQRDFLGGQGADLGEAPDVDADPAAAWRAHSDRVLTALSDDTLPATAYEGFFGPTTVGETLERFYVWDMVVHRWDVARAAGIDTRLSDAEIETIESGADSFGDALHMDGICKPAVDVPADADPQARALARLGRAA